MTTRKEIEKGIITDLQSEDETIVLEAIESTRTRGTTAILEILLNVLISTDRPAVYSAIANVLKDVKDKSALEPILNTISNPESKNHRAMLVSMIWEAGLESDEHLLYFTDLAIKDNYTVCLEALTVIENMEGKFPSADLDEAIERVCSAIANTKSDKTDLLQELKVVLQGFKE